MFSSLHTDLILSILNCASFTKANTRNVPPIMIHLNDSNSFFLSEMLHKLNVTRHLKNPPKHCWCSLKWWLLEKLHSSKELNESDVQHPKTLLGKAFFSLRPTAGGRWQKKRGFHLFFRQHSGIWLLLWCRWQGNETLRWHINTDTLCFPSFHSFILSYFSTCLCNYTLSGLFLKLSCDRLLPTSSEKYILFFAFLSLSPVFIDVPNSPYYVLYDVPHLPAAVFLPFVDFFFFSVSVPIISRF